MSDPYDPEPDDFVDCCIHGVPFDEDCEECELIDAEEVDDG